MYSYRVDILHGAYRNTIALCIAQNLILYLFVSRYGTLYQALMHKTRLQSGFACLTQFFFVIRYAAAGASESIRRANYNRVAYFLSERNRAVNIVYNIAFDYRLAYRLHSFFEKLSVLAFLYGFNVRAEELHVHLLEEALLVQLHSEI